MPALWQQPSSLGDSQITQEAEMGHASVEMPGIEEEVATLGPDGLSAGIGFAASGANGTVLRLVPGFAEWDLQLFPGSDGLLPELRGSKVFDAFPEVRLNKDGRPIIVGLRGRKTYGVGVLLVLPGIDFGDLASGLTKKAKDEGVTLWPGAESAIPVIHTPIGRRGSLGQIFVLLQGQELLVVDKNLHMRALGFDGHGFQFFPATGAVLQRHLLGRALYANQRVEVWWCVKVLNGIEAPNVARTIESRAAFLA